MFGSNIFGTGLGAVNPVLASQTVPQLIAILDARANAVLTSRAGTSARTTAMARLRAALVQAEARLRQPKPANVTQADWAVLALKRIHGKSVYDAQATPAQFAQRAAAEVAQAEAAGQAPVPVIAIPTEAQVKAEAAALPGSTYKPPTTQAAARPAMYQAAAAPGGKPPVIGPDGLPAAAPAPAVATAGMGPLAAFLLVAVGGGLILAATKKKKKPALTANPRRRRRVRR